MQKKISLLVVAQAEACNIERLTQSALRQADHPEGVQLIFAVEKKDKRGIAMIHQLAALYPVELFDSEPVANIKIIQWDCTKPLIRAYRNMEEKADGALLIKAPDYFHFTEPLWDAALLELYSDERRRTADVYLKYRMPGQEKYPLHLKRNLRKLNFSQL
jgi:hypothetical protein